MRELSALLYLQSSDGDSTSARSVVSDQRGTVVGTAEEVFTAALALGYVKKISNFHHREFRYEVDKYVMPHKATQRFLSEPDYDLIVAQVFYVISIGRLCDYPTALAYLRRDVPLFTAFEIVSNDIDYDLALELMLRQD